MKETEENQKIKLKEQNYFLGRFQFHAEKANININTFQLIIVFFNVIYFVTLTCIHVFIS